jgi:hypothetical protein
MLHDIGVLGAILLGPALMSSAQESLRAMSIKVDHAGICTYDLSVLQQGFADLGLRSEYGGAHAVGGTHNALLGFDDGSYIELIAPQHPETLSPTDAQEWTPLKPAKAQDCFWAVGSADIKTDVKRLQKAGIEIGDPVPGSRKKPDGTVLEWETARVKPEKGGDILPFLIEDKTPRSARIQPSASVEGTELAGIDIVVLGVKDLDASIALFRRAFGLPAPAIASDAALGAKLAYFPGTPVLLATPLATPLNEKSCLATQLTEAGQGPIGLLLRTRNFAASRKRRQLSAETSWFGRKIAWFQAAKLHGAELGVVE